MSCVINEKAKITSLHYVLVIYSLPVFVRELEEVKVAVRTSIK